MSLKIAVAGANGRMGQQIIKIILDTKNVELVVAAVEEMSGLDGKDISTIINTNETGIKFTCDIKNKFDMFDVLIDFTSTKGTLNHLYLCKKYNKSIIIGTTGFNNDEEKIIKEYSKHIAIVKSSNFSIGINLIFKLLEQSAKTLSDYDIEIIEAHHNNKLDAPSGTALSMGKCITNSLNVDFDKQAVFHREGIAPRKKGEIGFSTIRAADIIGEHYVWFANSGERIEINHKASDRLIFARGAIKAALWIKNYNNGLYSMMDVLNLK